MSSHGAEPVPAGRSFYGTQKDTDRALPSSESSAVPAVDDDVWTRMPNEARKSRARGCSFFYVEGKPLRDAAAAE